MNYWLFKSEPETFSIDHLTALKNQTDHWDGVRNYQARNFMRDGMKKGDQGFFYHSNCKTPGIVGTVEIIKEAYPDFTQFDPESAYYDPKSTEDKPRWFMVDVKALQKFDRIISLNELKDHPALQSMTLVKKGNRLSVLPVTKEEWTSILAML